MTSLLGIAAVLALRPARRVFHRNSLSRLHLPILVPKKVLKEAAMTPHPTIRRLLIHANADMTLITFLFSLFATYSGSNAPRKRRSRWGDASTEIPGLPTAISATGVSQAQLDNYAIHLRLEEINRKLRLNDYVPPERERSPSPPPTYDAHGRRTNTREVRYRKKLEDERIKLVDRAMKNDPNFRPPVEYHQQKRSQRPSERVYIPVKEFPEINFFGLLVGPRGNSLKKMERESGAKISIRGKGSVKEGKARPDQYADDAEEDLHCLVIAETEDKVVACVKMINRVIETAASTPEGQNDHKRNQLRELAALNGTLRDDENQVCKNCGGVGHRQYECPEQKNFTANIVCRVCGSAGHMARDCTQNKDANISNLSQTGRAFDSEYANLMAELGEGPVEPLPMAHPKLGRVVQPISLAADRTFHPGDDQSRGKN
ncbi:unnamed protein product [Mycena citricolor]|uniref:Branchpoint-bridging protein n=1 Tax=Mycena citricolor TaxID=2018698 RepID=A0AAD2H5Q0_9AGAR|nr:unnamed protein product [Mycena citricolor]